jgi:hypothetical protein
MARGAVMLHLQSLRLENLEARRLLSKASVAVAHPAAAAVGTSLVLDGKLAVDSNAAIATQNSDGSSTTATPVTGRLGTLGKVHGVWNETVDQFGDVEGLDALRLRDAKGTIVLEFNNQSPGRAHPAGHGAVYYEEAQRIGASAGGYSGSSESGSIEIFPNSGRSAIVSMVLHTKMA